MQRNTKRILTDAAGYLLILAGVAFGWLPGPGGIPLVLAGLGLLSINNTWAERLRQYLLKHGGKLVKYLFPNNRWVQWLYDGLVVVLLVFVGILEARHDAIWQISLGIGLFFAALFIALMNRDRLQQMRGKSRQP